MSRFESDREDLIRDATALRERCELAVVQEPDAVVVGFHRDGRMSIYFGADPVYQFDAEGRLRRAFVEGLLYRSQGTTLSRLERVRQETVTQLARDDLDDPACEAFLDSMRGRLESLFEEVESGRAHVLRQVPVDADVLGRIAKSLPPTLKCALAPSLRK
jgi:hypothetical protein